MLAAVESFASEGLRVLAAGSARGEFDVDADPSALHFQFDGLIAFRDPVRPDVPHAIAEARRAGVSVAMITGDHPATAMAVARSVGLKTEAGCMTGAEFDAIAPQDLGARIAGVRVFARIRPEQKLAIVDGFRAAGHVVAMTGDGVNDAPALKSAHVGIAMGQRGADVAREAADIVLLDDSFASIVGGVRLGRRIFANLRKALIYICAIHVPVAGLALLPILMGLPPILFPAHVMLLELIIDPVCALVFEGEPSERQAMLRPPRRPDEPLLGPRRLAMGFLEGSVILACVYAVYLLTLQAEIPAEQARALAFICLVCGNLAMAFAAAAEPGTSFFDPHRKAFWMIAAAASAILAATVVVPPLAHLFRFELPPLHLIGVSLGVAAIGGRLERASSHCTQPSRRRRTRDRRSVAHRDQQNACKHEQHADPVAPAQRLAQKHRAEQRDQHEAELVDRRDAPGVAELQRPEIAEPGGPGAQSRQDEEDPCAAGNGWRLQRAGQIGDESGERQDDERADQSREVRIQPRDADLGEDCGQRGETRRRHCPEKPRLRNKAHEISQFFARLHSARVRATHVHRPGQCVSVATSVGKDRFCQAFRRLIRDGR